MKKRTASIWRRVIASTIDTFILLILSLLLFFPLRWVFQVKFISVTNRLIGAALAYTYYVIRTYYYEGATIGKKVFSIKVISEKGKLALNQAVIRQLAFLLISIIPTAVILLLTGQGKLATGVYFAVLLTQIIVVVIDKKNRAIHDFAANTIVVDSKKSKKHSV